VDLYFSPAQIYAFNELLAGPARYACLFGGARSGKTFLIVLAIILRALKAPGSRHAMLRFRLNAVWTAIAGDVNSTIYVVAKKCFNGLQLIPHRQEAYFELPNGSTIWLGGLDDKERVDKILGREYSTMYLNEASEIPYQSVLTALTRLAEVRPEIKQRAFVDLNPVGKGHWTNRLFREGVDPVTRLPLAKARNYLCSQLNPKDNNSSD
jgi:phage terminase large subunit